MKLKCGEQKIAENIMITYRLNWAGLFESWLTLIQDEQLVKVHFLLQVSQVVNVFHC